MSTYSDKYSWKQPISDHVIEHHDGVYSFGIAWHGMITDLQENADINGAWLELKTILHDISDNYKNFSLEFHILRERDTTVIPAYIENHKKNMCRGKDVAEPILADMAMMYNERARTNNAYIFVTYAPRKKSLFSIFKKDKLGIAQSSVIDEINKFCRRLMPMLPGCKLLDCDEYAALAKRCIYGFKLPIVHSKDTDWRFEINKQWITTKPKLSEDGYVSIADDQLCRVAMLYMQQDALHAGVFRAVASINSDIHFSHVVIPTDTDKLVEDQDRKTEAEAAENNKKGRKKTQKVLSIANEFTSYVHNNNERIYKNVFIAVVYGEKGADIDDQIAHIDEMIRLLEASARATHMRDVGVYRSDKELQLAFLRTSIPGMGYSSPFFRDDHTTQVVNLAPVITFDRGQIGGESLRLSNTGQPVGLSRMGETVKHSMSVAMTRGGKGTEKAVEILETYTQGIDWMGIEFGGTYEWLVDALGGTYIKANIETSINPFPSLSELQTTNTKQREGIKASTIEGIAFVLLDKRWSYTTAEQAVAERAFDDLYSRDDTAKPSPIASDFLESLTRISGSLDTKTQVDAASLMINNLTDFLGTQAGKILNKQTNIDFTSSLTFIDFKDVATVSKSQAVFLLNYAAMKYVQKGFLTVGEAFILFDEVHKFMDIDAEATNAVCKLIARAGGKEAAWLDLITQGISELKQLDTEVLGSMYIKNLLYRQDQYEEIADRLQMPTPVLSDWSQLPDPLRLNYRPHIKGFGNDRWYRLSNVFPQDLLDIASTSADEMPIKNEIAARVDNVWERLSEFRRIKSIRSEL